MDVPTHSSSLPLPSDDGQVPHESRMHEPIKIFFCYTHKDEPLLRDLQKQLGTLRRKGIIDLWHDRCISPGTVWQQEIDQHLGTAHIILLLVSPDFIDSDYCYSIEMERAMQRHLQGEAHVIPIILRHVHWQETPFGQLQALPKDAIPIAAWSSLDEAFFQVAEGIRQKVEELRTGVSAELTLSNAETLEENKEEQKHSQYHKNQGAYSRNTFPSRFVSYLRHHRVPLLLLLCFALFVGFDRGWLFMTQQDNLHLSLVASDAACRSTCQPLWFYLAESAVGSSPAITNTMIYVGSDDDKLYAFDATCHKACQPLWSYQTGGFVYSSPIVANNVVYVGSRDGKLYAFDATCRTTCRPLWSYQTGASIVSSPTIANGTVYIGSYDHNLYAFGFVA